MSEVDEVVIEQAMSAGERLRIAREEKKLTIAEVAAQLRLVKTYVEHLENGQWEHLHGRAYARGYFSSYVKFLNLPEHEMLSAFNHEYKTVASEAPAIKRFDIETKGFPWFSFFFGLIALGIAGFAYQQWYQNDKLVEYGLSEPQGEVTFSDSVVEVIDEGDL